MLISKLIFYKTYVDNQTWHRLHPMKVGDEVNDPIELEKLIWQYFEEFKEITGNFELLIGERADIIFQMPFVSDEVIDLVKDILDTEGHYNFGKIPFDIIGRIFEELIREDERHKLGQYFTPPHVIDLINAFAIHKYNDKVFDPSCGSGTFLVRAYERKKMLCEEEGKGIRHDVLLNEIYGNDLSGYPAYLSMLNLAIRNTHKPSYPKISNKDFFAITENTTIKLHNQKGEEEKKQLPKFDAIIGNPPYTRQEDIGTMQGTVPKVRIQTLVIKECGFEPSQRTSIYAYFFYHASIFLKEGGYLAFICQNSWLDTEYGFDMQQYLLRNYDIVAIMDSEVERFFPSASVNTTIVILRKQREEDKRNENLVKFIYFKETLTSIIKNSKTVDDLYEMLLGINESIENNELKLNCVKQETLSAFKKWGQFLKAPKVYFDIMEMGKEKLTSLKNLADVKYGIKTGCNDYFVVKDITETASNNLLKAVVNNHNLQTIDQVKEENLCLVQNGFKELWLVENQFLYPMLTSPKNVSTYSIEPTKLPYKFLTTDFDKKVLKSKFPYLFEYIKHGEATNINRGSTLVNREIWYNAGERKLPDMCFSYMINDFGKTYLGKVFSIDNFQNIFVTHKKKSLFLILNSTLSWFFQQLIIRVNFGDGVGKIQSYELADMLIPNIDLENLEVNLGQTKNFKEELGTLENLQTVNSERLKLDNAILKEIGYTNRKEREIILLELYKATYQLIDARLHKAQSLKGVKAQRNKIELSVYIEQLKTLLLEENTKARKTLKFAKQLQKLAKEITSEAKLQKKILDAYWKEKFGELFNEQSIADGEQGKLF